MRPNEVVEKPTQIVLPCDDECKGASDGAVQVCRVSPRLLPGMMEAQLLRETFAHAMDLSAFDEHYRNDEQGAPACACSMLLKAMLLVYSQTTQGAVTAGHCATCEASVAAHEGAYAAMPMRRNVVAPQASFQDFMAAEPVGLGGP